MDRFSFFIDAIGKSFKQKSDEFDNFNKSIDPEADLQTFIDLNKSSEPFPGVEKF